MRCFHRDAFMIQDCVAGGHLGAVGESRLTDMTMWSAQSRDREGLAHWTPAIPEAIVSIPGCGSWSQHIFIYVSVPTNLSLFSISF